MIEVNFATALILYLSLTLSVILSIWGYQHYNSCKKNILPLEQQLWVCEYCHFAYLEESFKKINKCPQCGLFNQHNALENLNLRKKIKF